MIKNISLKSFDLCKFHLGFFILFIVLKYFILLIIAVILAVIIIYLSNIVRSNVLNSKNTDENLKEVRTQDPLIMILANDVKNKSILNNITAQLINESKINQNDGYFFYPHYYNHHHHHHQHNYLGNNPFDNIHSTYSVLLIVAVVSVVAFNIFCLCFCLYVL